VVVVARARALPEVVGAGALLQRFDDQPPEAPPEAPPLLPLLCERAGYLQPRYVPPLCSPQ